MTDLAEFIGLVRAKAANQKSKFIEYAAELDTELLAQQCREIMYLAPQRHQSGGKYLFERDGIPSSTEASNRVEEHLAMALYNKFKAPEFMPLPDGRRLEVLDYQVPLKAVRSDSGVGKVDMLGLIDGERLAVLELKVKGGDTPLAATLEALVYAAMLQANTGDIGAELENNGYRTLNRERLEIIILARADYWQEFNKYDAAWLEKVAPDLSRIAAALFLDIQFIELKTGHLEMGIDGAPPELEGNVEITSLYCSRAQ